MTPVLRRRTDDRFSEVVREWEGATAVIIAGGPSLSAEQVERVRMARIADLVRGAIAVNDAYLLAPFADVLYGSDFRWWEWQAKGTPRPMIGVDAGKAIAAFQSFAGQKCTVQHGEEVHAGDVHVLRNQRYPYRGVGLSLEQDRIITGRNSTMAALNLAVLAGAKRILLLGVDGRPAANGATHWFGEHPIPTSSDVYNEMRKDFSAAENPLLEAGVEVINCSPGTAIDSFPKVPLWEAL